MRTRRFIAAVALLCATGAPGARGTQVPDVVHASVRARVDYGWSVGIVVGVVDSAGARFFAYGSTAKNRGAPVSERTVYEIGSITKVFTAVVLADMAVRGEVTLDEPVRLLLPDSVQVPRRDSLEITLRLLASHRSGLPELPTNMASRDPDNPYADYDATKLNAFLRGYLLPRDPGARYEYSNAGVGLLGFALAQRAHTSYESLVRQRVMDPLGLADTRITLGPALRARLARGHTAESAATAWDFDALAGAGALRSTAADLTRLLAAAMGLERTPLDSAFRLTLVEQGDAGPGVRIALGWHVLRRGDIRIVWHGGRTGGYRSFIGFDPARKMGVVVLSNSVEGVDDLGFHLMDPTFTLMTVRAAIPMPAESLDAYLGEYRMQPGFGVRVRRRGANLVAQVTGQGSAIIYPSARDEFFARAADAQITFMRDAAGLVMSIVLHQNGRDIPGRRVP